MSLSLFPYRAIAILLLTGWLGTGCAPSVGDSCETNVECPSGAVCDNTAPEGYCMIPDCDRESCPANSVCVEFDAESRFCMEFCEEDRQCRRGYVCRDSPGPAGYCYVAE